MALSMLNWGTGTTMKKIEDGIIKGLEQEIQEEWAKIDKSTFQFYKDKKITLEWKII